MTPRVHQYAEEAAQRHGVTIEAMFASGRSHPVTAARWELWTRLAADGLSDYNIECETGHNRASIRYALARGGRQRPVIRQRHAPETAREPDPEGLSLVLANIAAMQAKHQRELAQRY